MRDTSPMFERLRGRKVVGIPTIVIDGEVIIGIVEEKILKLMEV